VQGNGEKEAFFIPVEYTGICFFYWSWFQEPARMSAGETGMNRSGSLMNHENPDNLNKIRIPLLFFNTNPLNRFSRAGWCKEHYRVASCCTRKIPRVFFTLSAWGAFGSYVSMGKKGWG